jgi:hypothetical protein
VVCLALGLVVPGGIGAQGRPHASDPVAPAEAFTAAWNAHDLPAVLAGFAPDAVGRERRGPVPAGVWDTRDPAVVRAYQEEDGRRGADSPGPVWVIGHQEIAAWAAARFAQRHRYAVGPYRATGETVAWSYREFADLFQVTPGVGPLEGDAEVVVRGGRITRLTLVLAPASVQRRWGELSAAARAAARGAGPSGPSSGPARAAAPTGAWPLALGGLAFLAAGTAALRRRRRPLP